MAAPTPTTTRETMDKMLSFITAFDLLVDVQYLNREFAMIGGGFAPGNHPFPLGMQRSRAFASAQYLVKELKAAEEPRLLALEPLCKISKEDVDAVRKDNMDLVREYEDKKSDVRKWRSKWIERLESLLAEYKRRYCGDTATNDLNPAADAAETSFFMSASRDADGDIDNFE